MGLQGGPRDVVLRVVVLPAFFGHAFDHISPPIWIADDVLRDGWANGANFGNRRTYVRTYITWISETEDKISTVLAHPWYDKCRKPTHTTGLRKPKRR